MAATSLAAIELGQAGVSAGRGAPPGFLLGEIAGVLVGVVVAVAALRVADGRVVALLVAIPGAGALAEAAGTVQRLGELTPPGVQASSVPLLAVRLLAAITLAVAAAGLWTTNRPLRDVPLAAARGTASSS